MEKLEEEGIVYFYDESCIRTGEHWKQRIRSEVKDCAVLVAILSPNYFQRYWCMHELDLALRHGRRILLLYFDPVAEPDDLPKDKAQFMKYFDSDERVENDELDRWWSNIIRLPDLQDIRMRSFASEKRILMSLRNAVVERVRQSLQKIS